MIQNATKRDAGECLKMSQSVPGQNLRKPEISSCIQSRLKSAGVAQRRERTASRAGLGLCGAIPARSVSLTPSGIKGRRALSSIRASGRITSPAVVGRTVGHIALGVVFVGGLKSRSIACEPRRARIVGPGVRRKSRASEGCLSGEGDEREASRNGRFEP
jgi:hypothetical protein